MDLKRVTIGYFNEMLATGIIEKGHTLYRLERVDVADVICIVDDMAVDIDNFENKYEIIERDELYRIKQTQEIELKKLYAVSMTDVNESVKQSYKKKIKQYKKLNHKV